MKRLVLSFTLFLFPFCMSWGAIPSVQTILARTVKNSGNGIYQIEQEVQFPNGQNYLVLRETWIVGGENQMHLTVKGTQEFKNTIHAQFSYNANKTSKEEFWEKYFHFRGAENLTQELLKLKILNQASLYRKPVRNLKDWTPVPQSNVRLARVGGVINYALGVPSGLDGSNRIAPGLWIEQDQFVVRKVRTPSGVEVLADKYSSNSKGLLFPQSRTIRWDGKEVQIQTFLITAKPKDYFSQIQKIETNWSGIDNLPAKEIIESFYSRFR